MALRSSTHHQKVTQSADPALPCLNTEGFCSSNLEHGLSHYKQIIRSVSHPPIVTNWCRTSSIDGMTCVLFHVYVGKDDSKWRTLYVIILSFAGLGSENGTQIYSFGTAQKCSMQDVILRNGVWPQMLVKTAEHRQLPRLVVNLVNRSVDKQKLCRPMHNFFQEEEPERLEGSEAS